ncbi:Small RNA degrading nuclease 2 [Raphanus sativus]|nr:Small RNA degrading nuclease 2 [Raphanus sativus]
MHIVRSRGLEGDHGSWDEFMKFKFPKYQTKFLIPAKVYSSLFPPEPPKEKMTFSRFLARLLSKQSTLSHSLLGLRRPIEPSYYSRWHTLVKTSLAREDYPLDYFLSPPFEDWVVTGIGRNKSRSKYFENIDAVALCCDMVLSQDESESHSVRVVAINSDFKVIIDELFTPSHSHEAVVQHLESASHTLSLADIQGETS